ACHAVMLPVSESKIKTAEPALPPGGVKLKSLVELNTVPVGKPPGIVIVCGLELSTTGLPATSPRKSCTVLVPLFAIQNGLDDVFAMPHGLTIKGSRT